MTSFKKSYGNSAFALKSWWCATASTAANKVGTSSTDAADHHILQAGQYSDLNIFDANNCLLIWNETAADRQTIFLATMDGILMVYEPTAPNHQLSPNTEPYVTMDLHSPIVHLQVGSFLKGSNEEKLLIVCKDFLCLRSLVRNSGFLTRENMRLELKSLPCSICTGSFGDGGDHNLLLAIYCVNGELIIIDSGVVTFKSSRISLNLYSPIIWDWISDSFIFHNSDSSLHCISYQNLKSAETINTSRPNWKLENIHSQVLDMTLARFFKTAPSRDLLLLTPASLFLIDMETGVLKRDLAIPFHHHATCMRTFPKIYDDPTKGKNSFDCLLVATQSQHIIVYQEWTCVWITKQSSSIPITLRVNTFGSHKGLVTTLSRTGDLTISYLSTTERLALPANSVEQSTSAGGGGLNNNPVPGQVTTSNGSSSSAGAAAKSRSKANANITGTLSNLSLSSFFTFECEIQHDPRAIDLFTKGKSNDGFALLGAEIHTVAKLVLTFHNNVESDGRKMDDFTLVIHTPPMVELSAKEINVNDPRAGQRREFLVGIYISSENIPPSLTIDMIALFKDPATGSQHQHSLSKNIPLYACGQFFTLEDDFGAHTIKLETNQDAISFEKIYKNIPNLVLMNDNALGFRYTSGVRVGIKGDRTGGSSGRYFISSDNLEAIWPIICDLKERLCIVFPSPELHVFYLDELPVSALNRLVEEYITNWSKAQTMSKDIQDLIAPVAEAERTFIEEVTAGTSPKENLEEQIETIQLMLEQIESTLLNAIESKTGFSRAKCHIGSISRLITELIRCRYKFSDSLLDKFERMFAWNNSEDESCWSGVDCTLSWKQMVQQCVDAEVKAMMSQAFGDSKQKLFLQ